ncbi:uncharacterized protein LOC135848796 [Planococcus citri]|uniref:uncharacterized protein LOC135848796 n=1 Tax=Planococcus citri TaxID=170843 RepID=UPI0031F7A679
MAKIASDVFDILHPTPITLRELSAIVITLEIWRCEINKYRSSNTLNEFCPSEEPILSKPMIRDLPSIIYPMIDKYVKIFGDSMRDWLRRHHLTLFHFHFGHKNTVLEYFEDFVCDYDGTIHYERTAERMMHCDRFNVDQKFLIACTYCFKDDIIRIWPFGLKKTDSLYKKYFENPQFAYWIGFLENDIWITLPPIEELMFDKFMPHNRPLLEYFWNLIPSENRLRKAVDLYINDLPSFVRFILPKLDDQQLNEFLHENGCELLYALLEKSCYDKGVILSTWIYVKNAMNEIAFTNLIVKLMQNEVTRDCVSSELEYRVDDRRDLDNFVRLCFEIWYTAAENLKRSAVRDIASNNELFEAIFNCIGDPLTSRKIKVLLAVLSHATYDQRNLFWHNCWQYLIYKTTVKVVEDLDKMMLRLREEDVIAMRKYFDEDIKHDFFRRLLLLTLFDEINQLVRLLLPEIQAARNFKQKILRLAFLNDGFCGTRSFAWIVMKHKEFDEFIRDAYENVDQSTDFKNELMSSPFVNQCYTSRALVLPSKQLIAFIETFASTERILLEVKTRMIDFLKNDAADFEYVVPKSSITPLLSWCLEGNEEVSRFELSYL